MLNILKKIRLLCWAPSFIPNKQKKRHGAVQVSPWPLASPKHFFSPNNMETISMMWLDKSTIFHENINFAKFTGFLSETGKKSGGPMKTLIVVLQILEGSPSVGNLMSSRDDSKLNDYNQEIWLNPVQISVSKKMPTRLSQWVQNLNL